MYYENLEDPERRAADIDRRRAIDNAERAGDFEAWKALEIAAWTSRHGKPNTEDIERFDRDLPGEWARRMRSLQRAAEERRDKFLSTMPRRAAVFALTLTADDPLIKRVSDWKASNTDGGILVLSGPAGVGKTVAACWWANQCDRLPTFMRASEFATISRYDEEARALWQKAHGLILDDLGAEYLDPKGSFLVDLDEMIDTFYAEKTDLVITTNCDKATFKARYGNRIVDRLAEAGTWLTVTGASKRQRASHS